MLKATSTLENPNRDRRPTVPARDGDGDADEAISCRLADAFGSGPNVRCPFKTLSADGDA